MTGLKLDLMTDPEMSLFIDRGLIGLASKILHPYVIANNPKCKGFDREKPTTWIKYLDANNLYVWSMIQYLSTGGFEWMELVLMADWESSFLNKKMNKKMDTF